MKNIAIFLIISLTISCATQKNNLKPPKKFDEISFGSLGGVTGAQNNYLLNASGEVYKIKNKAPAKINQVSKSEIRNIAKQIKLASFYNLNNNETGNMTYFIDSKSGEFSNKVTWSSPSEKNEVTELYKMLAKTLKPKSND